MTQQSTLPIGNTLLEDSIKEATRLRRQRDELLKAANFALNYLQIYDGHSQATKKLSKAIKEGMEDQ